MGALKMYKIKWVKGHDFIDNSARYTFEGRDPSYTVSTIRVVIYTERERKFSHDPSSAKNFYYGYVTHQDKEMADTIGRFNTLKEAKQETEKLFEEYCRLFPEDTMAC